MERLLRHDTLGALLGAQDQALAHMVRRDLLGQSPGPITQVWELTAVRRVLARQKPDGRWAYSGGDHTIRSAASYDQLETYRQLGTLVHKFGLDHRHPAVGAAAQFLASFQTEAGDYRGIYGCQYTPNYSAAITEVLTTAGYGRSPQVRRSMRWLMSMRQDDGGWAVPTRTLDLPLKVMVTSAQTFEPDRTRPSSHLITGIVLRALTAHPEYRAAQATHRAGDLLKSRLFTRDTYPDHAAPSYWLQFSYPFWWTDLLSALDSLTRAGYRADDPAIARALRWFVDKQHPDGLWNVGRNRPKGPYSDLWVAFAVCRMLTRALDGDALATASGAIANPCEESDG